MSSFNLGELHPAIIHFPIALIFAAFVFDVLYWFKRIDLFQTIAGWMIMVAAVLLVPTAITGFFAKDFYSVGDPDVFRHQNMAIVTALFTVGYAFFRGNAIFNHKVISIYIFLLLGLINIGLVNTTAEFGGIVVRGKGIIYDTTRPSGYALPYSHVGGKPDK